RGNYWTGTHTKHRLKYHFVWVPKYRKRILRGKIYTGTL
ncbi:MAG: transposase, partial [Deltaproteobacteria bacterium]|nr:transposase [Deltaproteobacteria bacterium]